MKFKDYINKQLETDTLEIINEELFNIFNNTKLKNYVSEKYPEIYPEHIGIQLDVNGKYIWGLWWYQHSYDDYFEKGWNFYLSEKLTNNMIDTVKTYFAEHNEVFYEFLKLI